MLCTQTNIQDNYDNCASNYLKSISPYAPNFYQRIIDQIWYNSNQIWNNPDNFNDEICVVKNLIPYLITPLFGRKWGEAMDLRNLSRTTVAIRKYISGFALEYAIRSGLGVGEDTLKLLGIRPKEDCKILTISEVSRPIITSRTIYHGNTGKDFLNIMESEYNLQEINFDAYHEISKDTLEKLTGYYPEFVKFHLGAIKYTTDGLLNFAKCCPNLMDLDLSLFDNCKYTNMTDDMLIQLAPLCPHLTNIHIDWQSSGITDKGIKAVADNCPELVSIFFTDDKILEPTLDSFANNCTNLRIMELNRKSKFTEKVLKKLILNNPHLTKIVLRDRCNEIWKTIYRNWENCKEIELKIVTGFTYKK